MTDSSKGAPLLLHIAGLEEKAFSKNTKPNQPSQPHLSPLPQENMSNKDLFEQYERILHENMNEITRLDDYKYISLIIGIVSSFVFLILLLVKLILVDQAQDPKLTSSQFTYYFLLIPATISLISFTLWANFYLKMNEIFDRAHKRIRHEENENFNFGNFLSYFTVNLTCICILLYLVLLVIKLQTLNNAETQNIYNTFNIIAIPCYFTYGILLLYFIFVMPAFLLNKWYFFTFMLANYFICSFVSFLLINFRLDNITSIKFLFNFAPLLFAVFLNLIYIGMKVAEDCSINRNILDFFAILLIFTGLDLIALRLDGHITKSYLPIIFLIVGLLLSLNYKAIFCKDEEDR
jgi:hypothetical protein